MRGEEVAVELGLIPKLLRVTTRVWLVATAVGSVRLRVFPVSC